MRFGKVACQAVTKTTGKPCRAKALLNPAPDGRRLCDFHHPLGKLRTNARDRAKRGAWIRKQRRLAEEAAKQQQQSSIGR